MMVFEQPCAADSCSSGMVVAVVVVAVVIEDEPVVVVVGFLRAVRIRRVVVNKLLRMLVFGNAGRPESAIRSMNACVKIYTKPYTVIFTVYVFWLGFKSK